MAKKNRAADTAAQAEAHARQGQSLALGDTGNGSGTGVAEDKQGISNRPGDHGGGEADNTPYTQAGAPQRQDQSRTSLDTTSESGRARDEGPDAIDRTGAQRPRRDAEATTSSDIEPSERETL